MTATSLVVQAIGTIAYGTSQSVGWLRRMTNLFSEIGIPKAASLCMDRNVGFTMQDHISLVYSGFRVYVNERGSAMFCYIQGIKLFLNAGLLDSWSPRVTMAASTIRA